VCGAVMITSHCNSWCSSSDECETAKWLPTFTSSQQTWTLESTSKLLFYCMFYCITFTCSHKYGLLSAVPDL